jgi:hypothetical protein
MKRSGRLARALTSPPARFLLALALLLPPWPAIGRAYGRAVGAWTDLTLSPAAAPVKLRFTVPAADDPGGSSWELRVHAEDPSGRYVGTVLDLRRSGYIASAVFAALALATPLRWKQRLVLMGAGLAILQLLPLLPLLSFFSGKLPVRAFQLGAATSAAVEIAYHALVAPPGMAYAVPALLWLLLAWSLDSQRRVRRPRSRPHSAAR